MITHEIADANTDLPLYPSTPNYWKNHTYNIISRVAYLIGVQQNVFENEQQPPLLDIFVELENDSRARIIRNLCRLRTAIERNFSKIINAQIYNHKTLSMMPELMPVESLHQLSSDGIQLKTNQKLTFFVIDLNKIISDRINNCKELFPIWVNWSYIKNLFIMPNGLTEEGIKAAGNLYFENYSAYPYQAYINWHPSDQGNILYNDKKFVTLLYLWNNDIFIDDSKVSDISSNTKDGIYNFIETAKNIVFVVDCENSDPYKLCASLRGLAPEYAQKVSKIILFDDVNTVSTWRILESYTDIAVEHILIERVKDNKSLVDIKLTAGTCREFYQNNVDSFVLFSSDSDYWGLISSIPEAKFLVMLEYEKTGPDMKNALFNAGVFYCFIDDFYSGSSNDIKIAALLKEIQDTLTNALQVNIKDIVDAAHNTTRTDMSEAEKAQFYKKYVKPLSIEIDEDGNLSVQLKRK